MYYLIILFDCIIWLYHLIVFDCIIWLYSLLKDGCQSAGFHPSGAVVAIGMTSGRWVALDVESQDLITVHTDGKEQHDIIRYSPGMYSTKRCIMGIVYDVKLRNVLSFVV